MNVSQVESEGDGLSKSFPVEVDSLEGLNGKYEDAPEPQKTWAEEVEVRELSSGLKIASLNYYEFDEDGKEKTEFTWDEAMERFRDDPNWRLPTPKELNQMVIDLGYDEEGVFDGKLFAKNLGADSLEAFEEDGSYGYYWSSTASSSTGARYLYFNSSSVYPQDYSNKTYGLAVRCVAR